MARERSALCQSRIADWAIDLMDAAAVAPLGAAPLIDGSPIAGYTLRRPPQTKIGTAMAIIFLAMWIKESGFSHLSRLYSGFAPSVP